MRQGTMTKNELLNQGFKAYAAGSYDEAIQSFEKALGIDPEFDLAINALAEIYNKKGDFDQAIAFALRLVELNPEDPVAHTALSRYYMRKGMIAEAEEEMAISNRLAMRL
jgi:tetratricopeptide (TPR) repeat protein